MIWKLRCCKKIQTKKFLAVLMAMLMTIGMMGCSSTPVASSSKPSRSSEATAPSSETENSAVESEVEENAELLETEEPKEEEEVIVDNFEEQGGEEAISNHGYLYYSLVSYYVESRTEWTVYKLNLDNLSCEMVSNFKFPFFGQFPHYECAKDDLGYFAYYHLLSDSRFIYSDDFSKCATTCSLESGEQHAGWLNSDGTFTDVTVAVGEASKNDFEVARHFLAIGFTNDGRFIYRNDDDETIHYVYVDDLGRSYDDDDSLMPELKQITGLNSQYRFTDQWIDNEHCLGNIYGHDSLPFGAIIDIRNKGENDELFFSEDSPRYNWNMLLSPDKTSVIFLSNFQEWYNRQEMSLYRIDIETREPELIPYDGFFGYRHDSAYLLDWRED